MQAQPHQDPASTAERPDCEPRPLRFYTTEQAAAVRGVKPGTLRAAFCRNGHYFGVVPSKGVNRMLRWPANAVDALDS